MLSNVFLCSLSKKISLKWEILISSVHQLAARMYAKRFILVLNHITAQKSLLWTFYYLILTVDSGNSAVLLLLDLSELHDCSVHVGECCFSTVPLTRGVHQGSDFGPCCFHCMNDQPWPFYVNDLVKEVKSARLKRIDPVCIYNWRKSSVNFAFIDHHNGFNTNSHGMIKVRTRSFISTGFTKIRHLHHRQVLSFVPGDSLSGLLPNRPLSVKFHLQTLKIMFHWSEIRQPTRPLENISFLCC